VYNYQALRRLGIIRIFSRLYFERGFACSLCASFMTYICLFIVRDVPRLHLLAEQRRSAAAMRLPRKLGLAYAGLATLARNMIFCRSERSACLMPSLFAWRPSKQELIQGERT
jgi:hypothetical protein